MAPPAVLVLLPAILVPALLLAIPASIWPAVIAYHAYCLSASFGWPDETAARPLRAASRGGRGVLLICLVLLVAGDVAARYGLPIDRLPDGWREIAERAKPWRAFAIYSLAMNGYVEFWGWLRRRSGTLWPCVVTHVAADAAILRVASTLLAP